MESPRLHKLEQVPSAPRTGTSTLVCSPYSLPILEQVLKPSRHYVLPKIPLTPYTPYNIF